MARTKLTSGQTKLDSIDFTFNSGSGADQTNTSTSYVDVTGSSTTYTAPAGNGVKLLLWGSIGALTSTANSTGILVSFNVNGVVVGRGAYSEVTGVTSLVAIATVNVAAGTTVTIKLQTKQIGSGTGTLATNNTRDAQSLPRIIGIAVSQ
jgi:hypothetical protein